MLATIKGLVLYVVIWGCLVTYVFSLDVSPTAWIVLILIIVVTAAVVFIASLPVFILKVRVGRDVIEVSAPPLLNFKISKSDVVGASIINLNKHEELRPTLRLGGIGLPGCSIGWFKLKNGSKAYLVLGKNRDEVVVFRLRNGNLVIIATKDMEKFVATLRTLGWLG